MKQVLFLLTFIFSSVFSADYCPNGCGDPYQDERVVEIVYYLQN